MIALALQPDGRIVVGGVFTTTLGGGREQVPSDGHPQTAVVWGGGSDIPILGR